MRGGLGPHILIIPVLLSLPRLRGAPVGRAPTIFSNDVFFSHPTVHKDERNSPIFSILQFFLPLGGVLLFGFNQ